MFEPSYVLLYVASPEHSAAFYAGLLDRQPVESSPGFALFVLPSGLKLGLWKRDTVQPGAVASQAARSELAFVIGDDDALTQLHADWSRRGLVIAQAPTRMDFGYTFVALDPDGHRLRAFVPSAEG